MRGGCGILAAVCVRLRRGESPWVNALPATNFFHFFHILSRISFCLSVSLRP